MVVMLNCVSVLSIALGIAWKPVLGVLLAYRRRRRTSLGAPVDQESGCATAAMALDRADRGRGTLRALPRGRSYQGDKQRLCAEL